MSEHKVNLPNNVRDAMRDNLPGQVSQILRDELEKGADAIGSLEEARKLISTLEGTLKEHGKISNAKSDLTRMQKEQCKLADELDIAASRMERDELKYKLDCETRVSSRLEIILAGLVRNTEWRETVHGFETCFNSRGDGSCTETKQPSNSTKEAE